ncbi:hypothetical protein Sme01_30650 [Sphaerisporangium melleum]|uniref:TetR family transcriptional regulator n=1 Tax=Sphaerisporangium melleum TaxID=321316 RepID=A0A917VUP3_9ACTN|nr:hypothetical protein [Sphaerisporangium melleum]GGL16365.1 hypothetical protein GCM10007964_67920 [Sphaerisporangium melleum]GII70589.1 hypothetical protein Sme01_30650 [Sphaerisporangium melleum]
MAIPYPDPHKRAQETRRRVLAMSVFMQRHQAAEDESGTPADAASPSGAGGYPQLHGTTPARAVETFLVLLQDRLPVWLRTLEELMHRTGKGRVNDNLLPVAREGIDYYAEVQAAAMPAFISPSITVRFREALRETELGPASEIAPLARYLAAERSLGRIAPDVTPEASARLLLAGCFRHAYYEMFIGAGACLSRDDGALEIVRELRLEAVAPRAPALS